MESCKYLNGVKCCAPGETPPSQAIELKVGSESDPTEQTVIRACGAAGWRERQENCSGNPNQPLNLDLVEDPAGNLSPWIT